MREIGLIVLALATAGAVGALVSIQVHAHRVGMWASYVAGQASVLIWAWQARSQAMSLSKTQVAGCACLLLGLILVNL